jgi:hypothetical protein
MPTPTTDFSIFDGQELVTYTPVSDDAIDNLPALRRPLTQSAQRNVERYVELQATDVIFHLESTLLVSKHLEVGDVITDASSITYQVLFFELQTLHNIVVVLARPNV